MATPSKTKLDEFHKLHRRDDSLVHDDRQRLLLAKTAIARQTIGRQGLLKHGHAEVGQAGATSSAVASS